MNPLGPDVATIRTSGCIVFSHGGNGAGVYEKLKKTDDSSFE